MEFNDAWNLQFTKSSKTAADETPSEAPTIECEDCGTKLPTAACEGCEGSGKDSDFPDEDCSDCDGSGRQLDESSPLVEKSRYKGMGWERRKVPASCNHHGTADCEDCDAIRAYLDEEGDLDHGRIARFHVANHRNPITGQDYWDRPENQ